MIVSRIRTFRLMVIGIVSTALVGAGAASANADSNEISGVLSCPEGQQVRIWSNTPAAITDSVTHYFMAEGTGRHGTDTWRLTGLYPVTHHTFTLENDTVYWRIVVKGDDPRFSGGARCYP